MQRKDLQEATASEPLSEEEEYEMQQTWLLDDDSNGTFYSSYNFLSSDLNSLLFFHQNVHL